LSNGLGKEKENPEKNNTRRGCLLEGCPRMQTSDSGRSEEVKTSGGRE